MNKAIAFLLLTFSFLLATAALALDDLGARPMGMGGAFVGLADDANSIFVNPAGVASVGRESVLVSTRLMQGHEYTLIGGVEQTSLGSFGIGYVGSTDPGDLATGAGAAKTQTLYITIAEDLNKKMRVPDNFGDLSLGVNFKFSSRKVGAETGLSEDGGSNIDTDLAAVYKAGDNLSFGLSLQNLINGQAAPAAGMSTLEGNVAAVQAGVSGKLFDKAITWSVENNGVGCEWQPVNGLSIRAGRDSSGNSTSGLGLNMNGFCVDYAFVNGAEPVHYWSVSILPAEPKVAEKERPKEASVLPDNNNI